MRWAERGSQCFLQEIAGGKLTKDGTEETVGGTKCRQHFLSLCLGQLGLEPGGDYHIRQLGEGLQVGAAFAQHLTPCPMGDTVLHREESVGHSPSFARHSPDSASGCLR